MRRKITGRIGFALVIIGFFLLSTACSSNSSAPVALEELASKLAKRDAVAASSFELLWQVPADSVEKYHLRYGELANALTTTLELRVENLQRVDHPVYGPIYRYLLEEPTVGETVYISLAAENEFGSSPPTEPIKLSRGEETILAKR